MRVNDAAGCLHPMPETPALRYLSFFGHKRTQRHHAAMSALCQKQTHAVQQKLYGYSMISSASNWIEFGTSIPSSRAVCMLITNSNLVA